MSYDRLSPAATFQSVSGNRDRRQHNRYPANNLDVLLKSAGGDELNWELAELVSVDFNQFGIAVESLHNFNVGDVLSLVICTDDGVTSKVTAIVCNRSICRNGNRYGLFFDYENTQEHDSAREKLADLENNLQD